VNRKDTAHSVEDETGNAELNGTARSVEDDTRNAELNGNLEIEILNAGDISVN